MMVLCFYLSYSRSELTVERADKFSIECRGDGSEFVPMDETNLVCVGLRAAFAVAGTPVPPLKVGHRRSVGRDGTRCIRLGSSNAFVSGERGARGMCASRRDASRGVLLRRREEDESRTRQRR